MLISARRGADPSLGLTALSVAVILAIVPILIVQPRALVLSADFAAQGTVDPITAMNSVQSRTKLGRRLEVVVSHKLGAAIRRPHYVGVIALILLAFFAGRLHGGTSSVSGTAKCRVYVPACSQDTVNEFWPEVDTYLTLSQNIDCSLWPKRP